MITPRLEARAKWLAENDARNAWQQFFDSGDPAEEQD
jgi:hypothetical protein